MQCLMSLDQKRVDSFQLAKAAKKVLKMQKIKKAEKVLEEVAEQISEEVAAVNTPDQEWTQGVDIGGDAG